MFGKKKINAEEQKKRTVELNRKRLVNADTRFDVKEAYKDLRTNIMFSLPGDGCKKVLTTSAVQSEGKSTTNFNLAITIAETGAKVILMDCDMRRPNIARLLAQSGDRGLSNVLVNDCRLDDAIVESDYKNLDVIFSGKVPPNPAELISSDKMEKVVNELAARYDYIIFDAPPINVVTDAALLSRLADGVVIVSRQFVTERGMLTQAIEKLKFVNAKIIGVVLNDVVGSKSGYGKYKRYGYKKYGYGYGYGYGEKSQNN